MPISTIPVTFRALVDDAAIFPPGLAPLPDAVVAHADHLDSTHRELVGLFIVGADSLVELTELTTPDRYPHGLDVSVVVPSPDAVRDAARTVERAEHVVLGGLEVKLVPDAPYPPQIEAIAADAPAGVSTYVEAPRPGHVEWPVVVTVVARHGLRLKFRTGGTESDAFPSDADVATWVHDAVAHGVPFKCTAGLHHAIRHTGAETGFEHHGYLNILLASARAVAGATLPELTAVVGERSASVVADAISADPAVADARQWFTSYGSCSILEPLEDLRSLGLIAVVPTGENE